MEERDLGPDLSQFLQLWRRHLLCCCNTEFLILPRLRATDWQEGKSRSTLHFSFLICSALLSICSPFCLLQPVLFPDPYHYISVIYWCISIFVHFLLPFLSFPLLFPELFFQPSLILSFLLWSDQWDPEGEIPSQGRCRNPGISQSVKKKLQRCKISSVFSIKAPKAILRVRQKEGSHDNWRLNSIWCLLLMSLLQTPEWKLMMPSPGWCISSTMT